MKFSEESGIVMCTARAIATARQSYMIRNEDLLSAIAVVDSPAKDILRNNAQDYDNFLMRYGLDEADDLISEEIDSEVFDQAARSVRTETRRVIVNAAEISRRSGSDSVIRPEHLLFVLIARRTANNAECINMLTEGMIDVAGVIDDIKSILDEDARRNNAPSSDSDDFMDDEGAEGGREKPAGRERSRSKGGRNGGKHKLLEQYGKNLTQMAKDGKIDPVIGREEEINRVMQILARRTKNNPCLVGDPGVGKTAIAEGLALKIASNDVPEILQGKTVYGLDMGSLVAGAKFRGDFEDRIKGIMNEAVEDAGVILFIDEIHTLIGAGDKEGGLDAANIMKPMLTKNELQVFGATTMDEYSKYIEKDSALERRFQKVIVGEPSVVDSILILKGLKSKYEEHHKIRITDEAVEAAVKLSSRYLSDRFLPDKAIDLVDEAAARKRINFSESSDKKNLEKEIAETEEKKLKAAEDMDFDLAQQYKEKVESLKEELEKITGKHKPDEEGYTDTLTVDDIQDVLSKWTGIPVSRISEDDASRLKNLEAELKKRVIGQDEAVTAIAKAIRRSRLGLKDPGKPSGSFIFMGTTGVGKTELAKALAETMFGDENSLVRIDMSEYMEKHTVSKLIGSPPGYVGYDEGGQLTEKVRRRPYSVVLFDEIEKAHPDIFNAMLQILDDGRLTDGKGRVVDFKNTIIIMTSNIGAKMLVSSQGKRIGFSTVEDSNDKDEASREGLYGGKSYDEAKKEVLEELKKTFSPEFVNRVDEIIFFRMLGKDSLMQIVDLLVNSVGKRVKENGIEIRLTPEAKELIAKKGYDPQYGARPLRRVIQATIEDRLAEAMLDNIVSPGKTALFDADGDEIVVRDADEVKE